MPYYGSAYGVKHYGSEGLKSPTAATPSQAPASAKPDIPVAPPAAIPPAPQEASDPMGDSIAKLFASLSQGINDYGGGSKGGHPFLDRLKAAGNPMWQYFGQK